MLGGDIMPYIRPKEVFTPLKLLGIRFYKDLDTGKWYVKRGKKGRLRALRRNR